MVVADRGVEQVPRSDARWIVVIVFGARRRNIDERRAVERWSTGR